MKKMKLVIIDRNIRKYVRNNQIFNILESLKTKVELEDLWILVEFGKEFEYQKKPFEFNYKYFKDYKTDNLLEILDIEKPDAILISNDYDFFMRSFIPAAKFKKIPIILLLSIPTPVDYLEKMDFSMMQGKFTILKNRGRFILNNFLFMLKTYRRTGSRISEIIKIIITDLAAPFLYFYPSGEHDCDLVLVTGKDWKKKIERKKNTSEIKIIGYPTLDDIYRKVLQYKSKKKNTKSRGKIVLMSAPMVEHGLWTQKQWEETIRQIIITFQNQLSNEMDLVLKIHPATERKKKYVDLLQKIGCDFPIYQTEDLMEILNDADFVITYSQTSGILDAAFLEKPVIVVNLFDYPLDKIPFLKEGLAYELKEINKLKEFFSQIDTEIIKENLRKYISNYLYKFDGKSSERAADAILEFVKNYKK